MGRMQPLLQVAGGQELVVLGSRIPVIPGQAIAPQAYAPSFSIVPSQVPINTNTSGLGGQQSSGGNTVTSPWSITSPVPMLIIGLTVGVLVIHFGFFRGK